MNGKGEAMGNGAVNGGHSQVDLTITGVRLQEYHWWYLV